MYSIVMMAAVTAAPDTPQFNGYFRDLFNGGCNGCSGSNGCSGGVRYSCYGGGCSGAVAYPGGCTGCNGCNGCCGGGSVFGLGLGDRVRSFFDRDDNGGCCGSRSFGCSGASYACTGYSCSGYSCFGSSYSCFGSSYSCFGGPVVSYTPMAAGGLSCHGGIIYSGAPMTTGPSFDSFPPYPGQPNIPYAVPDPAPGSIGMRPAQYNSGPQMRTAANGPTARASVVVKVPADARLWADNQPLNLTGEERKFVSPELPMNQDFVYRFKVEYERDGELVSVTKKVTVRGGATAAVEFSDLTAVKAPATPAANPGRTTAAPMLPPAAPVSAPTVKPEPAPTDAPTNPERTERATITVKLPPGATLYVDDRKSPSQEPVRQFATPPLPANREFAYLLKAEIVRDGRPETLSQKVPFRAGEKVTVDFTSLGK